MKTNLVILGLAAAVAAAIFFPRSADAQPPLPKGGPVESPLGLDCFVTVETQAWMGNSTLPPSQNSGFQPDYTLRGKVIAWGSDWLVLKDGNYENWVSRDKVLTIRVSR